MGLRLPCWEHLVQVNKKTPPNQEKKLRGGDRRGDDNGNHEAAEPVYVPSSFPFLG